MYHNQKYKRRKQRRPERIRQARYALAQGVERTLGPTWERLARKAVRELSELAGAPEIEQEALVRMVLDVAEKSNLPAAGPQCEVLIDMSSHIHDEVQYNVRFTIPLPPEGTVYTTELGFRNADCAEV